VYLKIIEKYSTKVDKEGKGKVNPITCHEGPEGGVDV
jgi:hypothetical protein